MQVGAATLIIDIITIAAVLAVMYVFFFRRKSVKLMLLYTAVLALYITVIILEDYAGVPVPIARGLISLAAWFLVAAVVVVYQSDFKVMFFNLRPERRRTS